MPGQMNSQAAWLEGKRATVKDDSIIARELSATDKKFGRIYAKENSRKQPDFSSVLDWYFYNDQSYSKKNINQIPQPSQGQQAPAAGEKKGFDITPNIPMIPTPFTGVESPPAGAGTVENVKYLGKGAVNNIVSLANIIPGVANVALNPNQTADSIVKLGAGLWMKARGQAPQSPIEEEALGMADSFLGRFKNEQGNLDLNKFVFEGGGADVALLAGGAGKVGRLAKAPFKGAAKAGAGVEEFGTALAGKATGAGIGAGEAFVETIRAGTKVQRGALKRGKELGFEGAGQQLVTKEAVSLDKILKLRESEYVSKLEGIAKETGILDKTPISSALKGAFEDFKIAQGATGKVRKATKAGDAFSKSAIPAGTTAAEEIKTFVNELQSWGKQEGQLWDAIGLDTLKKRLRSPDIFPTEPTAAAFATRVMNGFDEVLNKVPGYEKMTGQYKELSGLISDVRTVLRLETDNYGRLKNPETALNKITSVLRSSSNTQISRKALVEELDRLGGQNILPTVAGASFSEWLPRGLMGVLTAGNLTLNGFRWLTIISSPKFAAGILTALGYSHRAVDTLVGYIRASGSDVLFSDTAAGIAAKLQTIVKPQAEREEIDWDSLFPPPGTK